MRKLVLVLFILSSFNTLQAAHIFGGEIWYEYIGDSTATAHQYIVNLRLYSDWASLGPSQSISINSSCYGSQSITAALEAPQGYIQDTNGAYYLPEMRSCNDDSVSNFSYDLYVHHYKAVVTLPGKCSDFTISYSVCCRQSNIDNLVNANGVSFYFETVLNNTIGPNTSPEFIAAPVTKFCNNQKQTVSHGASEPDLDSIHYKLSSINGSSGNSGYSPGYSPQQPMLTLNGTNLDSKTGLLTFASSQTQGVALRINAEEYRYDTTFGIWLMVGYSTRDIPYFT